VQDVRDEKISLAFARREHGVVIDPVTLAVDRAATEAARAGRCQGGALAMGGGRARGRHRSQRPGRPQAMVFLTGDVLDAAKREFLEGTGAPFLTKPFDVPAVRRLVDRMLATTR